MTTTNNTHFCCLKRKTNFVFAAAKHDMHIYMPSSLIIEKWFAQKSRKRKRAEYVNKDVHFKAFRGIVCNLLFVSQFSN